MDMYCGDELLLFSFQTGIVGYSQIRSQEDIEANSRFRWKAKENGCSQVTCYFDITPDRLRTWPEIF